MALVDLPGAKMVLLGPNAGLAPGSPSNTNVTIDAVNEAIICVGYLETSDGASHTINTTGSSSIQWRTGTTTFANGATTAKVGIAPVLTTAGPPARASNAADVISFDVAASFTGGGGGITNNAWQTSVPTTGTKTIANGDLVAICVQMTARAGVDSITVATMAMAEHTHRPLVTAFVAAAYTIQAHSPSFVIVFSDGALGWLHGSDVSSARATLTFNSGGATKEYGQLYNLPFPCKIYGIYGWVDPDNDFDVVLYSAPLGTPVAEKTITVDANTVASTGGRRFFSLFPAPYTYAAGTEIVAALKPGAANIAAYSKTLGNAAHRVADVWGTSGYGVSRATAAFSNLNSSLDHLNIGLVVGAFDNGAGAGGGGGLNVLGGRGGVIQ